MKSERLNSAPHATSVLPGELMQESAIVGLPSFGSLARGMDYGCPIGFVPNSDCVVRIPALARIPDCSSPWSTCSVLAWNSLALESLSRLSCPLHQNVGETVRQASFGPPSSTRSWDAPTLQGR